MRGLAFQWASARTSEMEQSLGLAYRARASGVPLDQSEGFFALLDSLITLASGRVFRAEVEVVYREP
jgi:hypothetical protein